MAHMKKSDGDVGKKITLPKVIQRQMDKMPLEKC